MKGRGFALIVAVAAGGAAQRPQPTPAAPAGPWMVFFDWGKPDIRGDDQAVLGEVVAAFQARPGARLQLSGHTDRSGNAVVNRAAGMKRAQAVRSELEKRGIPGNAMSAASFGEEQPLVATEDGVREVQNRRVVIAIEE